MVAVPIGAVKAESTETDSTSDREEGLSADGGEIQR